MNTISHSKHSFILLNLAQGTTEVEKGKQDPNLGLPASAMFSVLVGVMPHHVFLLRGTEKQNGPQW